MQNLADISLLEILLIPVARFCQIKMRNFVLWSVLQNVVDFYTLLAKCIALFCPNIYRGISLFPIAISKMLLSLIVDFADLHGKISLLFTAKIQPNLSGYFSFIIFSEILSYKIHKREHIVELNYNKRQISGFYFLFLHRFLSFLFFARLQHSQNSDYILWLILTRLLIYER